MKINQRRGTKYKYAYSGMQFKHGHYRRGNTKVSVSGEEGQCSGESTSPLPVWHRLRSKTWHHNMTVEFVVGSRFAPVFHSLGSSVSSLHKNQGF